LFLSVNLQWFPSISNVSPDMALGERLHRVFLPALTLTLVVVAHMMRMTRAAIINLMASPYMEMATFKGMTRSHIILKHALPNAWAPIVNVIAINLAYLIVDSVSKRDIPVVQACAIIFAVTYVLLNLIADVLSIVSNPRLLHPR